MKLIDKDALVAEMERLYKEHSSKYECDEAALVLDDLEDFIDTLEVKEVDLDKEIKEQIDKYYENCNKKLEEMGEDDNDISFLTLDGFARHFYELGLKAKGE